MKTLNIWLLSLRVLFFLSISPFSQAQETPEAHPAIPCHQTAESLNVSNETVQNLAQDIFNLGLDVMPRSGSVFSRHGNFGDSDDWEFRFQLGGAVSRPIIDILDGEAVSQYRFPDQVVRVAFVVREISNSGYGPDWLDFITSKTPDEISQLLSTSSFSLNPSDARVLRTVFAGLRSGGENELLTSLSQQASGLTKYEKLAVVQTFGDLFLSNYDQDRNDEWIFARGSVSLGRLMQSSLQNIEVAGSGQPAGVCRDISSAQAKMLESLGFRDPFVVAFMESGGVYHTTVAVQDPYARGGDKRNIIKINYGQLDESPGLYQGDADSALNYIVNRPDGRTVANVQSSLGFLLSAAAGGHAKNLDVIARPQISLSAAELSQESSGTAVRAFVGQTEYSMVAGLAGNVNWDQDGYFPGQLGLALAFQNRFHSDSNNFLAYLDVEQMARTPELIANLNDDQKIRLRAELMTKVQVMANYNTDSEAVGVQGNFVLQPRIRAAFESERVRIQGIIGAYLPTGLMDSSDVQSLSAVPTEGFVQLDVAVRPPLEDHQVVFATQVILAVSELGVRGRAEAGVSVDDFYLGAFVEGRGPSSLGEVPFFIPGAERRAGARFSYGGVLNLEGSASLESNDYEASINLDVLAFVDRVRGPRTRLRRERYTPPSSVETNFRRWLHSPSAFYRHYRHRGAQRNRQNQGDTVDTTMRRVMGYLVNDLATAKREVLELGLTGIAYTADALMNRDGGDRASRELGNHLTRSQRVHGVALMGQVFQQYPKGSFESEIAKAALIHNALYNDDVGLQRVSLMYLLPESYNIENHEIFLAEFRATVKAQDPFYRD